MQIQREPDPAAQRLRQSMKVARKDPQPGYVRMWQAMRALRRFNVTDLCHATGLQHDSCRPYLKLLEQCGYIWREPVRHGLYRLVKDTGELAPERKTRHDPLFDPNQGKVVAELKRPWPGAAPESSSPTGKMWRSMRVLGVFSRGELQEVTELKAEPTGRYISALSLAGYLRNIGQRMGYPSYQLIRNSGPLPPVVHNGWKLVWDYNDKTVYEIVKPTNKNR